MSDRLSPFDRFLTYFDGHIELFMLGHLFGPFTRFFGPWEKNAVQCHRIESVLFGLEAENCVRAERRVKQINTKTMQMAKGMSTMLPSNWQWSADDACSDVDDCTLLSLKTGTSTSTSK